MKKYFKRVSVAAIACAVAFSSLPGMTIFAEETQNDTTTSNSDWSKDIDSMLEGKDYVEGEVIAVFDNSVSEDTALSTLSDDEESENLGTLSDDAVEETVDADLNNSDEAAAVRFITSDEKSTEELLNELASNPAVICAQPNYKTALDDSDETGTTDSLIPESDEVTAATTEKSDEENTVATLDDSDDSVVKKLVAGGTAQDLIGDEGQNYETVVDLSRDQWGYNNDGTSLYSIHSPNWNTTGETNVDEEEEIVVGIMDTGIDYTHPDLKDQIINLSEYVSYAGPYGYNSSGDSDPLNPMDMNGHGTHCAGIMAAKWDGIGTSGVASGVKIAAVKATALDGYFYDSSEIRGFMCFKEAVEKGMNLKTINCSFGGDAVSNVELMMINELGKLGVITCFASGNEKNDNDNMAKTSSAIQESPYGIVVDADNGLGDISGFSCFGQSTTDLFAPGVSILSTTCKYESKYMASADNNRLSYDGFTGGSSESGVKIYSLGVQDINQKDSFDYNSEEEFLNIIKKAEEGEEAGKVVEDENSYDGDGYSYEIEVPALEDSSHIACYLIEMPIKEEDVNKLAGFSLAMKSSFNWSLVSSNAFEVSTEEESEFEGSADITSCQYYSYSDGTWVNHSVNLENGEENSSALTYYNGKLYFLALVQDRKGSGTKGTLSIDSVGAGYSNLRYVFLYGTSMATPAITGATAVVYNQLEESGKLNGFTKAEKAAYVADTVKAKTVQRDNLKSKCTTEGSFDFNVSEADYTPVIDSSEPTSQGTVVIEGNFLGTDEGTVKIDGKDCQIKSWSDTNVVVEIPDGLENGRYSLDFTKSNGKTATKKIIIDTVENSEEQAFEGKIELPDELKECQIQLTAVNGILYAFPKTISEDLSNPVIWNTMWSYDKDENKWEKCADIPVSEKALSTRDDSYSIYISNYKDYVIAHVNYITEKTPDATRYADEYYIYNPKKASWTELDLSGLNPPKNPIICGTDAGLFVIGGYFDLDENTSIYKVDFNIKNVEAGAASVKATGFTKAGACEAPDLGYASVSTYGNEIFICGSNCTWLKWSEDDQKFDAESQEVSEEVGGSGQPINFIANFAGCLTPSGAVITAMNGNAYDDRGYDTFYLSEDGTRTNFGKVASYADLYNSSACYSEGIMYVWGDSEYTEESTMGVLSYTSVNMPKITNAEVVDGGVKLTWRAFDFDANVRVFYKTEDGSWKVAGDVTGNTCTINGLTSGTKYTFTLRLVDEFGVSYLSSYDKVGTSLIYLDKTTAKAANAASGIKLSWNKVKGATGYKVYRKVANGSYKLIKTIKKNTTVSFTDKTAKNGTAYTYYVEAYKGESVSAHNTKTLVRLTRPQIKALKNTGKSKATVKWSKNSKATGYQILYKCGSKSKKITVKSYKTVKKIIKKLKKNKTYRFYVRSYKKVSGKTYYSSWSKAKKVKVKK